MDARSPADSTSVLAQWMSITHANNAGSVHGGAIMKLVDDAAALAAVRHSRRRVVTASIDRMNFLVPISTGELVTLRATVNAAWRTSMEVGVRVEAEDPRTGAVRHASTAYLTMVAVDDDGVPAPVPPLRAIAADEVRRMREAEMRRANRLAERTAIEQAREHELIERPALKR
jgi:uncharacterized protein (TIGR00369 family)